MKKLFYIFGFIFLLNCSNNNEEIETPNNEENNNPNFVAEYNLFINGVKKDSLIPNLIKTGDLFFVKNNSFHNTDDSFTFFDDGKFGNFSKKIANPYNSSIDVKTFQSFLFNSSGYFDLNIENIDLINKTIKGTFTGYVYHVKSILTVNGGGGGGSNYSYLPIISLNNEKKHVWCSFKLKYKIVPSVTSFYHTAKINNVVWESSYNRKYINPFSNSYGWYYYDFYDANSNFNIQIHNYANEVGSFAFNNTSFNKKVIVKKYNSQLDTVENYIGSGTLNVNYVSFPVSKGTYSFQGYNENNPNDIINITDGSFSFLQ